MNLLKINPKKSKAQAMVEFAIVLPILLLVVYGLIEVGRLIFIVASVNNATRQAARYGSTSGIGDNGVPRYEDCAGIRRAFKQSDFLNVVANDNQGIKIWLDNGPGTPRTEYCTAPGGIVDNISPTTGNRVTVTAFADYDTIVPGIVPFLSRTVANGNPITGESSRTLLLTISIKPPKEPTVTYITSDSPDPSEVGGWVTVSVEVASMASTPTTPTGTVAISGPDIDCTITLVDGAGSCNVRYTTYVTPETRTITASYLGDDTHDTSSAQESHTVTKASSVVNITADTPDPSITGGTVTVSVDVTSLWGVPGGNVNITGGDGSVPNCTITLSGGTGNCSINFVTSGTKVITATYVGDSEHLGDTDTATHEVIVPGTTTTTITSDSPDPSTTGQTVTVNVSVTSSTTPTGTITITGADSSNCSPLSGGTTTCTVTFNSLGNKTITATYTPDTLAHLGSSDTEPHTVALPAPTITIIDSPDPSSAGQSVAVTVTVAGGAAVPTGTVTITGADANCTITLSGGTGSCNVVFNTSGSKTLTATYNGDATHGATSKTEPHTVTIIAPPIAACNTLPSATNPSILRMVGGNMVLDIANPFGVQLQISAIQITWNSDKGHKTGGDDKTLILQGASLGGGSPFWSGSEIGPNAILLPNSPASISANSTSTLAFIFHQAFERWDNTESVEIFFANPGCETVSLKQTVHE